MVLNSQKLFCSKKLVYKSIFSLDLLNLESYVLFCRKNLPDIICLLQQANSELYRYLTPLVLQYLFSIIPPTLCYLNYLTTLPEIRSKRTTEREREIRSDRDLGVRWEGCQGILITLIYFTSYINHLLIGDKWLIYDLKKYLF